MSRGTRRQLVVEADWEPVPIFCHQNRRPGMSSQAETIRQNLQEVRSRIALAARRSGRSPDDVTLVAVTKYADVSVARVLLEAGCRDLAESRPQELWRKAGALSDLSIRWHLVGHLQSNKVRRTVPLVSLIHSVDTPHLLTEINRTGAELQRRVPLLIEVKIAQDSTKHGFASEEVAAALEHCARLDHVEVRGLMGMSSREGDSESARREFSSLRELRDRLRPSLPDRVSLDELSMGMSDDFELAIAEGATLVRIGSRLFQGTGK